MATSSGALHSNSTLLRVDPDARACDIVVVMPSTASLPAEANERELLLGFCSAEYVSAITHMAVAQALGVSWRAVDVHVVGVEPRTQQRVVLFTRGDTTKDDVNRKNGFDIFGGSEAVGLSFLGVFDRRPTGAEVLRATPAGYRGDVLLQAGPPGDDTVPLLRYFAGGIGWFAAGERDLAAAWVDYSSQAALFEDGGVKRKTYGDRVSVFKTTTDGPKLCVVCGCDAAKRCGACRVMPYCSKECATSDWRRHKLAECNAKTR